MQHDKILVVDFGGQYTQLIAKAVRKCSVFSEIIEHCKYSSEACQKQIQEGILKGMILSGGPDSVYQDGAPTIDDTIFQLGIPVLGICYGMQLMNHKFGGNIIRGDVGEYGETRVNVDTAHPLFQGLESTVTAFMSHGDSVDPNKLAHGFTQIAETEHHVAAISNPDKSLYGVQFHPEVTHTPRGLDIIANFTRNICNCSGDWTPSNFVEDAKEYVRQKVGKNDVICFVSGGVDSTFDAALLSQTEGIGKVHYYYIDALMRQNETEEVIEAFASLGAELNVVRAEQRFIDILKGMSDPEEKRKAIGNLFGVIMTEICQNLNLDPDHTYLVQGTLYTDLIESGKGVGKKAATIKSHHNVGCKFIDDLKAKGLVVEPNRQIFKDEVRAAAKEIGLPPNIYTRQPFPGPGLGIRIVDGHETSKKNTKIFLCY